MSTTHTHIVTLICAQDAANLHPSFVEDVANLVGDRSFKCLTPNVAYDIFPDSNKNHQTLRNILEKCLQNQEIDYTIVPAANRRKKLLLADMDSTMIDQECIDELADFAGFKAQVSEITARAMNGELEFELALRERVLLLQGLDLSVIDQVIAERITLAKGGKTLVGTMKANGAYCALVSGGFTEFTKRIASQIGFDENRANRLHSHNGKLTGTVADPILGSDAKVQALNDISRSRGIPIEDAIAVGDGANDLPMLNAAGLGIALHAKPSVAAAAKIKLNHSDLTGLLYVQGYTHGEISHA